MVGVITPQELKKLKNYKNVKDSIFQVALHPGNY